VPFFEYQFMNLPILNALLNRKHEERPSADELLKHPFLFEDVEEEEEHA
jgi:hypothetical protein